MANRTSNRAAWVRVGELKCWSCREWFSNNEIENADGCCPACDVEIDRSEYPYTTDTNNGNAGELAE